LRPVAHYVIGAMAPNAPPRGNWT